MTVCHARNGIVRSRRTLGDRSRLPYSSAIQLSIALLKKDCLWSIDTVPPFERNHGQFHNSFHHRFIVHPCHSPSLSSTETWRRLVRSNSPRENKAREKKHKGRNRRKGETGERRRRRVVAFLQVRKAWRHTRSCWGEPPHHVVVVEQQ